MKYKERAVMLSVVVLTFCLPITVSGQEKPTFKLGGTLRFNYTYSDWKTGSKDRGGDFGFDVFRLNMNGTYKKILLDAEYRFYPASSGGGMLKYGWIGYRFDEKHQLQIGQTAVPFGIQPYTANNYYYNVNCYVGLEDESDMGVKYIFRDTHWEAALAFFKNSDLLNFSDHTETSPDRYGYDVAGRNKEVNHLNGQLAYYWGERWKQQVGASVMIGGLYNLDTKRTGSRMAYALHYVLDYGYWNLKAQYTTYRMNPQNKAGENRDQIVMGAYGSTYHVAAKADLYCLSLAYRIPVNKGFLDEILLYNDFSMMDKHQKTFHDTYQNATGCMLTMGPIYTYIDYVLAKNHAWIGKEYDNAFAEGVPSDRWNVCFNVNIGYYF